ncbi:TetR/AcrR family transcriptional regulator [Kineococcus gypseus]|uniref:TetR/AcrR family transcriptional regulator n=1 Tax=Kineococcus gypseus TaxID=1637102 RepID=UPI003D7E09FD
MSPRPAPDLSSRREQVLAAARDLAESEGWAAVTVRRLAATLGVTQPVLYTVFAGRQAVVDAVALAGFADLADALAAAGASPPARVRAYLGFAAAHPGVYEAMFSLPSGLPFAAEDTPEPMRRAFAGVQEVFPDGDGTRAEVAWSLLHGLATLEAGGRLRAGRARARSELAHRLLAGEPGEPGEPGGP